MFVVLRHNTHHHHQSSYTFSSAFIVNENVVTLVVTPAASIGAAPSISYVSPSDKYAISVTNLAVTSASSSQQTLSLDWELG